MMSACSIMTRVPGKHADSDTESLHFQCQALRSRDHPMFCSAYTAFELIVDRSDTWQSGIFEVGMYGSRYHRRRGKFDVFRCADVAGVTVKPRPSTAQTSHGAFYCGAVQADDDDLGVLLEQFARHCEANFGRATGYQTESIA